MTHRRTYILYSLLISCTIAFSQVQSLSETEKIRILSDSLLSKIISEAGLKPASHLFLLRHGLTSQPVLYTSVINSLFSHHISVVTDSTLSDTTMSVAFRRVSIEYGKTFSNSIFGTLYTVRTTALSVDVSISTQKKIMWAGSGTLAGIDTVRYSDIQDLHSNNLPTTMYTSPTLSFFDSIFEPLIITVASGVAIYLFFTIRS